MKGKSIIFLFILIFVGLKLEAQYKKFNFDTIFFWKQFNDFYQGPTFNQNSTYQIKKIKDTIINLKTYHKMGPFGGQTCGPQGCYPYFQNGLLWNDTLQKRIYFYDTPTNSDVLLYDFSLNPGDTLKNVAQTVTSSINLITLKLNKIDSVLGNDSKYYRRHIYDFIPPSSFQYKVLESIGSNVGLLTPYYANANGQDWLICYGKINPYFNIYWNQGLCGIISTDIKEYLRTENSDFNIYPNPVENFIYFNYNEKISRMEVFDINGKKIIFENTTSAIDISKLQSGLIMIKAYFQSGNISIRKVIKE